jgi:hypothetical protein
VAKKQKNTKHKEAVNRKKQASKEMAKFGLKLNDDRAVVGFVFNHLAVSHLTYLGLNSINLLCRTYAGLDICIFTQHLIPPCLPPLCPIFGMSELIRWHHYPLITTSIGTTIEALASNASLVYHYAFDPEFIDKPHIESSDLLSAFCDQRVRIIARHESHKELIENEFKIKICDDVISDCNAEKLTKFVLTEMKNADRIETTDKDG